MPQIPSYGYDETTEGDLNSAKRRIVGFMDSTHDRLTEYPQTDPTNGEVSVELSELTDDIYIAIKAIESLDNYVRVDQMIADVVSINEQSAELKKTTKELLSVNNSLRKISTTYDRLRLNTKYVELSIWTDFTSSVALLRKASYKFFNYMDKLIEAEVTRRGGVYIRPAVIDDADNDEDDDDDDGPGGGPDGGPDDGGEDPPPDDGGDEDEGVLEDYDIVGELPGASPPAFGPRPPPAFGPPMGAPPPSPPMPPPSAPKPPRKPAVPLKPVVPFLTIPPTSLSDGAPFASPSTDRPPSKSAPDYEKPIKGRTFTDAWVEYLQDGVAGKIQNDKAFDKYMLSSTTKAVRDAWEAKLNQFYDSKGKLPSALLRWRYMVKAIDEVDKLPPILSPLPSTAPSTPLVSPSTLLPDPLPLPPPPSKKPKKPVLTGPPLADLPPPRPEPPIAPPVAPPVASPPGRLPTKFSDDELFWPDLVAETIPITDIDKLKALPTWPDLTTSQQTKFENRFNLDKSTLASGRTPQPLKPNSVYFVVWKKLLGTSTPRAFKAILSSSKTPRKIVKV